MWILWAAWALGADPAEIEVVVQGEHLKSARAGLHQPSEHPFEPAEQVPFGG